MDDVVLRLNRVPAVRGAWWVRNGWRVFAKNPWTMTSILSMFLIATLLISILPVLGSMISIAALPLLSLIYMIATQTVAHRSPPTPVEPMKAFTVLKTQGDAKRWQSLAMLCALYLAVMAALMWWGSSVDQGASRRLLELLAKPRTDASMQEIENLLNTTQVLQAMLIVFGGSALASIPFWHAPALIWWGGQGVFQAMFSSLLGIWRCKAAFTMYGVQLAVVLFGITALLALVGMALGGSALTGILITAISVAFVVIFYGSLWFSFEDMFVSSPVRSDSTTTV